MKTKRVEVLPHGRNPIGSFAVIKLFGISRLDGPAAFQLEPIAPGDKTGAGWPVGDLRPIGVRAGNGTVELLIGPEITKIAVLRPGVTARFRMPAAEADITIEWPDLTRDEAGAESATKGPTRLMPADTPAPQSRASTAAADPATAGSKVPVERGLARLQRRGTAAGTTTNTRAVVSAKSPPAPVMPDISPVAVQAAVPMQTAPPTTSFVPLALGAVIVIAMLVMFLRTTTLEGSGVTLYSALTSLNAANNVTGVSVQPSKVLSEILKVGSVSPAGIDASGVSRRQALERANQLIAKAQLPKARAEAAFWLRQALSQGLSEPRLIWAVTQLGTAHATTANDAKPNYDAARLLWNWAADAGDAQAACFLGRMYERGLGVASSARQARAYYERARRMGGCPGLEQAMVRVGNAP